MLGFLKKKKKKDDEKKEGEGVVVDETTGPINANNPKDDDDDNNQQTTKQDNGSIAAAAMSGMMGGGGDITEMLKNIDTSGMSLKEKMGLKMLQKLPKKKQEEVMRQALNPQELHKHKDQVLKQIDEMVASGQIDKGQAEAVKSQMGLR